MSNSIFSIGVATGAHNIVEMLFGTSLVILVGAGEQVPRLYISCSNYYFFFSGFLFSPNYPSNLFEFNFCSHLYPPVDFVYSTQLQGLH